MKYKNVDETVLPYLSIFRETNVLSELHCKRFHFRENNRKKKSKNISWKNEWKRGQLATPLTNVRGYTAGRTRVAKNILICSSKNVNLAVRMLDFFTIWRRSQSV